MNKMSPSDEALKNSLSLLEAILESIHHGILVVSHDGIVLRTNTKFAELWHIPENVLASKLDSTLLEYAVTQLADPGEFMSKVTELYTHPEDESLDLVCLKDGRILERISKPIYLGGGPAGRVWSFLDITQRKQVEEDLLREQYLMAALMDNIPDHIYFKDLSSRFFRNNRAHLQSFGLSDPAQMKNKSDFDFFVKEAAQPQYDDEQEIIRTGRALNKEELTIRNDQSRNWYNTTKMPLLDKDKKIVGTFGISRDITDHKRAEDELRLKNEQLITANTEKDKFFSIIAHDIRSPFNAFLGFTRIMAEELPSMRLDDIQKMALLMRKSATNLYRLLENLLEWSSLQRGVTAFNPASMPLLAKTKESMVFALEAADKKEISVGYQIAGDLEVFADENMFASIIRNLSMNAVKFTLKGGEVTIAAKKLPGNTIEISIRDTGIGMSREMVGNLFHLDINTSRKGTEGEPSTGLGLVLCRDFIERNNGKIRAESEEGRGTTFYFTLPATEKADPPDSEI